MKRPPLDFPEHTSEEERKALAKFGSNRGGGSSSKKVGATAAVAAAAAADEEDDPLAALLAEAERAIQPIYTMDAYTYWIKRLVAETVFGDCRIPPDPAHDSPAVLADKQLYAVALKESAAFNKVPIVDLAGGGQLATLIDEAKVLIPTEDALNFYPQNIAYTPGAASSGTLSEGATEVLHVLRHIGLYVRSAIIHCCRSQGGAQEAYLDKNYEQLWGWLVGDANKALPVSAWPAQSGLPFVDYMRGLWRVYTSAAKVV